MPKLKTRKSMSKRLVITKAGTVLRRTAGQDHFNSKERGKERRNKRRDLTVHDTHVKVIKSAMPYN